MLIEPVDQVGENLARGVAAPDKVAVSVIVDMSVDFAVA